MLGWGAAWNGTVAAAGYFSVAEEGHHINELELSGDLIALRSFVRFSSGRNVELVTESFVTADVVRNMMIRSPRLLTKLRSCEGSASYTASPSPRGAFHLCSTAAPMASPVTATRQPGISPPKTACCSSSGTAPLSAQCMAMLYLTDGPLHVLLSSFLAPLL